MSLGTKDNTHDRKAQPTTKLSGAIALANSAAILQKASAPGCPSIKGDVQKFSSDMARYLSDLAERQDVKDAGMCHILLKSNAFGEIMVGDVDESAFGGFKSKLYPKEGLYISVHPETSPTELDEVKALIRQLRNALSDDEVHLQDPRRAFQVLRGGIATQLFMVGPAEMLRQRPTQHRRIDF